jgi:hypothetical protein
LSENPYSGVPFEFGSKKSAKRMHINALGDVFLNDGFLSSNVCAFGNIYSDSLSAIENNLNENKLLKLFHFQPLKYFFYPWRKYVDLEKFCVEFSAGKILNGFYVIELVLGLLQRSAKQFDKSAELAAARRIYTEQFSPEQTLAYLTIIESYGDLSDISRLRDLLDRVKTPAARAKIQTLLQTIYSYDFQVNQDVCKK